MTYEPYYWLTPESRLFLERGYLTDGQTPEDRIKEIADRAEVLSGIEGFSERFQEYMSKGFYSLSSPVWANYGTKRGLPVSCFGSYIDDDMGGILSTHSEVGMLSKFGGGTSAYFGDLRPRGAEIKGNGKSSGSVHFMELFDTLTNVVSQGSVRRGFFTAYLPIEHNDFYEFIGIGNEGHPIQNITHGVTVTDAFMSDVQNNVGDARKRWAKVIQARNDVGYPYIFFTDTVNRDKPECFKDKKIYASNLCSEIALPSSKDETFVCVLSSMNLLHYDEWKETDAVEVLTVFLDTVCDEFILRAEEMANSDKAVGVAMISRAVAFTKKWRALGLGVLGWHSYLQSKMIPFESVEAAKLNVEIFRTLQSRTKDVSVARARELGSPFGGMQRNATLIAIAPTKSSSFILGGVSQGVEPEFSNFFIKDLAKVKVTAKNKYLEKLLIEKNQNTEEVWETIKVADGSVQHLDFLSEEEKAVFKTFVEINPETVIDQAGIRQRYIDQSQSINLMVDPAMPTKDINALYFRAWSMGLKTLYYQYNLNAAQALRREKYMNTTCTACEG
jgi:ribonucleoside-diphosphate reductase alpha chain